MAVVLLPWEDEGAGVELGDGIVDCVLVGPGVEVESKGILMLLVGDGVLLVILGLAFGGP